MKLELTDKEAETILQFVDLGLKSQGMGAIGAANMVIQKIQMARQIEQNETATPVPFTSAASG